MNVEKFPTVSLSGIGYMSLQVCFMGLGYPSCSPTSFRELSLSKLTLFFLLFVRVLSSGIGEFGALFGLYTVVFSRFEVNTVVVLSPASLSYSCGWYSDLVKISCRCFSAAVRRRRSKRRISNSVSRTAMASTRVTQTIAMTICMLMLLLDAAASSSDDVTSILSNAC